MKWVTLLPVLLAACLSYGQSWTSGMDNYTPTQGVIVNPSFSAASKSYVDLNIASGYGLIRSDYVYYKGGISGLVGGRQDNFVFEALRSAQADIDMQLPSISMVFEHLSFGINTRIRSHATLKDVPGHVSKFFFDGLNYEPLHNSIFKGEDFYLKMLAWGEVNLNAAGIVYRSQDQLGMLGGNFKILRGLAGASLLINDLSYSVDSTSLYIHNADFQYAVAVPGANKGRGIGLDIGYTHRWLINSNGNFHAPHSKKSGCNYADYKFKLGASILDIGRINMNKDESRSRQITSDTVNWGPYGEGYLEGLTEYDQAILTRFTPPSATVIQEESYKAGLPTALLVQADYNFENNFYAYGVGQLAWRRKRRFAAERMNMMTVGIRYEKPRFMAAVPLSIYQYKSPTIGLHLRWMALGFGTRNIMGLFSDTYGTDVYLALKWQWLKSRDCRKTRVRRKSCPKPKRSR